MLAQTLSAQQTSDKTLPSIEGACWFPRLSGYLSRGPRKGPRPSLEKKGSTFVYRRGRKSIAKEAVICKSGANEKEREETKKRKTTDTITLYMESRVVVAHLPGLDTIVTHERKERDGKRGLKRQR